MSKRGTIIVVHKYPPIPVRHFDWLAYHDGEEEDGPQGWGATPEEAIADLERLDQERAEAEEDDQDRFDELSQRQAQVYMRWAREHQMRGGDAHLQTTS